MDWRKYVIIILITTALGCNNKKIAPEKKDETITEEVNREAINTGKASKNEADMEQYEQMLKKYGFKFPDEALYNNRLKEVFGIDLKEHAGKDFVEIKVKRLFEESSDSFPEAVVKKKFIFWYPNEGWDEMAFVNINKYIFYNDKAAFTYLKLNDGNGFLIDLVQDFGYEKDNQLLDYIFNKTKGDISDGYAYLVFIGRNGVNGKYQLRKELFNQYFKANPGIDIFESKFVDLIMSNENYEGNKEADAAFLLDKMVIQCNAAAYYICGWTDDILLHHEYLKEDFRKNNYYNFEELKEYIEFSYENDFSKATRKKINDPDGYTNLRSEKNSISTIIEKIKTGTEVAIIDDTEDWYLVQTKDGKKGYVHKSRIK